MVGNITFDPLTESESRSLLLLSLLCLYPPLILHFLSPAPHFSCLAPPPLLINPHSFCPLLSESVCLSNPSLSSTCLLLSLPPLLMPFPPPGLLHLSMPVNQKQSSILQHTHSSSCLASYFYHQRVFREACSTLLASFYSWKHLFILKLLSGFALSFLPLIPS